MIRRYLFNTLLVGVSHHIPKLNLPVYLIFQHEIGELANKNHNLILCQIGCQLFNTSVIGGVLLYRRQQ